MKTIINTIASPFTLDQYHTFTTDSTEENILLYQADDGKPSDYDSYDWTYDIDAIHRKLGELWCEFVLDKYNLWIKNEDIIIKDCKLLSIHRPKYYNYTTDSADIEVEFDTRKLNAFIKRNEKLYREFCERSSHYTSTPMEDYMEKLAFYMEKIAVEERLQDEWICFAYEGVNETMYNSISYDLITK